MPMPLMNAHAPVVRRKLGTALVQKWGAMFSRLGAWWLLGGRPHEPSRGFWQTRHDELFWTTDTALAHHALFACVTLIASDVAKLRPKVVQRDSNGIWSEVLNHPLVPRLMRPNHYQNHIQFKESWLNSKLLSGNTYVLKAGQDLHVLDPTRVKPAVSPDGSVFYEVNADQLAGLTEVVRIPASEIIHDRINTFFHPLCGITPIMACGLSAHLGLSIERNAVTFFANHSLPSMVLSTPSQLTQEQANAATEQWKNLYSGANIGKVAALGNGLTATPLRMTSVDAQLIEQLKMTAEMICSAFHVPPFKIGVGNLPTYNNGELLDSKYYSDCLQIHIEAMELALDEGLGLTRQTGTPTGVELDLDGLLRMDTATQYNTLKLGVDGGFLAPNEARRRVDYGPVEGGDTPYMQQQNFSLAALQERDDDKPFAKPEPAPTAPAQPQPEDEERSFDAFEWETSVEELCLTHQ